MLNKIKNFRISALLIAIVVPCWNPAFASSTTLTAISATQTAFPSIPATSDIILTVAGAKKTAAGTAMNRQKIDPALLIEMERLEEAGQSNNSTVAGTGLR